MVGMSELWGVKRLLSSNRIEPKAKGKGKIERKFVDNSSANDILDTYSEEGRTTVRQTYNYHTHTHNCLTDIVMLSLIDSHGR